MWLRSRIDRTYFKTCTNYSRLQWLVLSCSYSGESEKKTKMAPLQERRMIDRSRIWAKGGDGGNGCSSFRRSRRDRRGRPDGGNGGRGGDVILECSPAIWDLSSLQHHINAKRGGHGAPKNMIGSRGADKVVLVPVGTVVHLIEGEIPSSVEKKPSGPLDPWDIPGSLVSGSSESPIDNGDKSEKTDTAVEDPSSETKEILKQQAYASWFEVSSQYSPSRNKLRNKPETHIEFTDTTSESLVPKTKQIRKKPAHASRFEVSSQFSPSRNKPETRVQFYNVSEDLDGDMCLSESEFEEDVEEMEEIQYDVAELTEPGQRLTVAQGGDGGLGNLHSVRGSKNSDENVEVSDEEENPPLNIGIPGSEVVLMLELKSIADVGLVGMPNAGKSTLLGAISRAKPNVGHYAFTTLRPNLGNLNYDDLSITVADIPGLIRGAHQNRGLGHAFLRHIERTKVLAYVLDLAAAINGRKGLPPWEQLKDLMLELECYREGLSERPSLVVANKIDEVGAEEVYEELKERVTGVPIYPVCAVLEEGVAELKSGLKMLVNGQESSGLKLDSIVLD